MFINGACFIVPPIQHVSPQPSQQPMQRPPQQSFRPPHPQTLPHQQPIQQPPLQQNAPSPQIPTQPQQQSSPTSIENQFSNMNLNSGAPYVSS